MPTLLPKELADNWLVPVNDELDIKSIQQLIKKYPDGELTSYPVQRLRGKEYLGNVKKVTDSYSYPGLKL